MKKGITAMLVLQLRLNFTQFKWRDAISANEARSSSQCRPRIASISDQQLVGVRSLCVK